MQEPSSHPIAKRIESWGDFIGVAVATERESLSPRYGGKNGWMITDQFLIQSTFFTFDVLRLSDLLWAYKTVTRHSVNFIPTGKTYAAVMICYGGAARIESSEKTTEEILGFVAQRAPSAIFGFTKELERYFNKNTSDFCAVVEQRKRELAQVLQA